MLRGAVRIIGGEWRSRQVRFPSHLNIKPTPDRVRETLFNWLAPEIEGLYCLDLFAGSGALGFEALSRGAGWAGFIERTHGAVHALNEQIKHFKANDKAHVYHQPYHRTTQEQLIANMPQKKSIDLVFLDPPFRKGMLEESLKWLSTQPFLSPRTYCYMEYENHLTLSEEIMEIWRPFRQKRAGQLSYGLWVKEEAPIVEEVQEQIEDMFEA